jgi:CBS domain-containing protein
MWKIADIMTRYVEVVSPHDSVQHAAQRMDKLNVGVIPVCEGNKLVGMLTDRDITVRATADARDPVRTRVHEIMTAQPCWCTPEQTVEQVMAQMGDAQVRRLPVLDARGALVGIVSLGDLATRQNGHTDRALREISSPSEPYRSAAA